MANEWFNIGKSGILAGTIDLDSANIRLLLLKAAPTIPADLDVDTITALLASTADECDATNYARKINGTDFTLTVITNDTDNRADIQIDADLTYANLGGALNNTVVGALLFEHNTNDSDSIPIVFFDIADTPTNGGNFTLQWPTDSATARCVIKM